MREDGKGRNPKVSDSAALHRLCYVAGDVEIGDYASVWPFAVLRGDVEKIRVGAYSNVQDNAVLHAKEGLPTVLGEYVTVGHGAVVHGARIGDRTVVGMGAIVLDGAVVEEGCTIGAGCVIPPNKVIPRNSVAVGNPYRILRTVSPEEAGKNRENALHYVQASESFRGR